MVISLAVEWEMLGKEIKDVAMDQEKGAEFRFFSTRSGRGRKYVFGIRGIEIPDVGNNPNMYKQS